MPEFRVRFEKDVGLPFTVGEISQDLDLLVGDYIEGVEIKDVTDWNMGKLNKFVFANKGASDCMASVIGNKT